MANFRGTEQRDFIRGTPEDDFVLAFGGNDLVDAGAGSDFVNLGDGNDEVFGGGGDDTLGGGAGDDVLGADGGFEDPFGGGNDLLLGGDGNDTLASNFGDDTMIGGDGDDRFSIFAFFGADGHKIFHGGEGSDWLEVTSAQQVVNLGEGTLVTQGFGNVSASFESIENFRAGAGPADITGSAGANELWGGGDNDTINGSGGNDTLVGDFGSDTFVFDALGEGNADFIRDFNAEPEFDDDVIALDSSVMTELGALGQFSADDERFHAAAGATGGAEEDDRVIYDTDSGRLYYDADGSGDAGAQLFAIVDVQPWLAPVTAQDFFVV